MVRVQTVVAGIVALAAGMLILPACSTTDDAGPSCTNGSKDDGEEGVDCGGTCGTRCTGAGCTQAAECASGKCDNGMCGAPAGKPCGVGATPPVCENDQPCELDKDCKSSFCDGSKCGTASAESHTDGKKNGGETGIDCGGSVKADKPCPDGEGCTDSLDCTGTCDAGTCGPPGPKDLKKNGDETDVDCGGATAPKCANGKACADNGDCADGYCPAANHVCTAPTYTDGVQNGDETDVDCGGTTSKGGFKTCAEGKVCKLDSDCLGACNYAKKCVDAPSCKGQFGGDTCGQGGPGTALPAAHESCCKSLEVKGYTDPIMPPGKTKVYLDKYEITAGRMRQFLEALGGGVDAAGNAKPANVKAYMATHRPNRWNQEWENTLPQGNAAVTASYTVSNPTVNQLYFGQDVYATYPKPGAQPWSVASGTYNVDFGVFLSLGGGHLYPETIGGGGSGVDYGASHALNCYNGPGSYGYSTYWFDDATTNTYSGAPLGKGKFFTKDQLDEKSLTCSPFGLLAAFCAWDGGQLATAEVIDNVTGNTVSPVYSASDQNGKLAPGKSTCGPGGTSFITYSDGASPCFPYFYPNDMGNTWDGSSRIAPPGRMPADAISKSAGDEPWMDLIGNLHEAVLKAGETQRFDRRGYGHEYTSILYHRAQHTTPRGKGGSFGGRCMRFK